MIKNIAVLTLTAGIVVSGIFFGCHGMGFFNKTPEEKANFITSRISGELDLTDDQNAVLERIKDEVLQKFQDSRAKHRAIHNEAIVLVKKEKLDKESVYRIISKKEAMRDELKPFIVDKIIEFHEILTPEQKDKLAEKMEKFHNRFND